MGKTLTYKILENALVEGRLQAGEEIKVSVVQTLTQDSTGTMVYLQLEAMDIETIQTECSVAYIDHNTLQSGFENADDHLFIQSAAAKYGIIFSKAGNGICHQLHLERFGRPGSILIGSDSHTPTAGGLGMVGIGAGGLDVAAAMATGSYTLKAPRVYGVHLFGQLPAWCSAKDVILTVLEHLSVKGGVGYVMEYFGSGVSTLSVTDRATITNMGAELGATSSIFPSDDQTLDFLKRQGRREVFVPLSADHDAQYDDLLTIDLSTLVPKAAAPHGPDQVHAVSAFPATKVDQVSIGSCTNASYTDLMKVAAILKGRTIAPHVSLTVSPGSSNILKMMADQGALGDLIAAGARILEASCGPCIGMGQAPKTNGVSLRTFNRNFKGRCGTDSAQVFLVSPEVAAVSALTGYLTDPAHTQLTAPEIQVPDRFAVHQGYFIYPDAQSTGKEVVMGPNIHPFPVNEALADTLEGTVLLKTGDNVTTDDIMPSGAKLLPYRSNIPELSKYCFGTLVDDFKTIAQSHGGGIVVGGDNYGQGSSREHAALVPLYLGVRSVIAKSFARIHKANLVNSGIVPLTFMNQGDYDAIDEGDVLRLVGLYDSLATGASFAVVNITKGESYQLAFEGSKRDIHLLLAGGYLNDIKATTAG